MLKIFSSFLFLPVIAQVQKFINLPLTTKFVADLQLVTVTDPIETL